MGFLKDATMKVRETRRRIVPGPVKRLVASATPLEYFFDEPVAQVYITEGDFDTFLCINNFYSVLTPEVPVPAVGELTVRDGAGRALFSEEVRLEAHGSVALSVRDLLAAHGTTSPVGLASLQLRPRVRGAEAAAFKKMGTIASHFFTYYLDRSSEAMAIIHPQSTINQTPGDVRWPNGWRTGQTIATHGLAAVELYQANHAREPAHVTYTLADFATGAPLATRSLDVGGLGVGVATFRTADLGRLPPTVHFTADRLPTPNGKPLLMRRYPGGRFSMSHS